MALRDIFKFRDLPESETSKPFLEHLEDLRWMIVKMAITLTAAMILCFAFRSSLVRIMQAPDIQKRLANEGAKFMPKTPDEFAAYKRIAEAKGFLLVASSPLTRSSHHAGEDFARLKAARHAALGC